MEKIKFTVYINQLAFYRAGLVGKIDLDDLALLSLFLGFERQKNSKKSGDYTWIDYRTASNQLPFSRSLRSISAVSRAMKRLVEAGLIDTRRVDRAVYARSTGFCRQLLIGGEEPESAELTALAQEQERQHSFPQAWQHAAVLDSLLVDLAPATADAVVLLTVAAHMKGRAMSVVAYAASLARSARDGRLDLTTLSAVSSKVTELTRTDRHPQARGDDPAREVGKCAESFRQKILDARKSAGI